MDIGWPRIRRPKFRPIKTKDTHGFQKTLRDRKVCVRDICVCGLMEHGGIQAPFTKLVGRSSILTCR
jgi:hypothetical protein